jgi:hypothetical protein
MHLAKRESEFKMKANERAYTICELSWPINGLAVPNLSLNTSEI